MKELDQPQADLDAAVEKYFKEKGWDGFTSGWVLVAHQYRVNLDNGEVEFSGYPLVYMGGTLSDHAALGLLQVGNDVIRHIGRWGNDEED